MSGRAVSREQLPLPLPLPLPLSLPPPLTMPDVAMLGFFVSLHTLASIIQQIHTIIRWRDVKTAEHNNIVANVGNPELNITGGATGLDLVLFYIRASPAPPGTVGRDDHELRC